MRGNRELLWWAIRSVLWDESWRIGEVGDSRESRVGEKGKGEWEFWRRPARGALKRGPAAIGDQV